MVSRCVFIVALRHLCECTVLEKGEDFVLHDFPIYSMATFGLSNRHAMCCYRCPTGNSNFMICSDVSIVLSSTEPSRGDTLSLDWQSNSIAIDRFSASQGVLCFQDTSNSSWGKCAVLGISGGVLSVGPKTIVNYAPTGVVAVTVLSATRAVLCYRGGDALSCSVLSLADVALNVGTDLALNLERPLEVSAAAISETKMILCWRGASTSIKGKCLALVLDGDSATQGPTLEVSSENLGSTNWYASVVALSEKTVALCYQDIVRPNSTAVEPIAKCNAIRVRGSRLDKGDDLLLTAGLPIKGATDFSIARLSDTLGVVCYHGGMVGHYTTCNTLNLFGNTLAKGPDVVVHDNGAQSISTSPMSDTSVLVCYRSSPVAGDRGICNVLLAKVAETPTGDTPETVTSTTFSTTTAGKVTARGVKHGQSPVACALAFLLWMLSLSL